MRDLTSSELQFVSGGTDPLSEDISRLTGMDIWLQHFVALRNAAPRYTAEDASIGDEGEGQLGANDDDIIITAHRVVECFGLQQNQQAIDFYAQLMGLLQGYDPDALQYLPISGEGLAHLTSETVVTAPDGTEYTLPRGYSLVSPPPGQEGHRYMTDVNGNVHLTPWYYSQAVNTQNAISQTAYQIGVGLFVFGTRVSASSNPLAAPLNALVMGVGALMIALYPTPLPAVPPPPAPPPPGTVW